MSREVNGASIVGLAAFDVLVGPCDVVVKSGSMRVICKSM